MDDTKVDIHMPFFIGDYLADTTDLTTEEHGAYLLILMDLWRRRGTTTSDHAKLARIAKLTPARWRAAWGALSRFFTVDGPGMRQKRLLKEFEKAMGRKIAASTSGARGAEKRWGRHSDPNRVAIDSPVADGVAENGSLSPSSSPEISPPAGARAHDPQPTAPPADGLTPFRTPSRPFPLATKTLPFKAAFDPYPRKDAELRASVVFQEIAETFPGGEQALSAAVLAAYARGILKHHPYTGPNAKRPYFETFLAERRWEDQASAPDNSTEAARCWFHQKPGTNGRTSSKPDQTCVECRHVAAGTGSRASEPTAPALPRFEPPPAWTDEQRADMAATLRSGAPAPPPPRTATGGGT